MPDFSLAEQFPGLWSWEFLGFITGILSVLLLIPTQKKLLQWMNWPAAVISGIVYGFLFYEWGLYGNMALQPLFVVFGLYGAWYWRGQLPGIVREVKEIPTTYADTHHAWAVTLAGLILMVPVYPILSHYGDPSPLWDGLIFCLSLSAIYLQMRKFVQSWYLWIAVDIIAIPFHWQSNHGFTAILYAVYMGMCFWGWYTWKKDSGNTPPPPVLESYKNNIDSTYNDLRKMQITGVARNLFGSTNA